MSKKSNVEVAIDAKGIERALRKFKRLCESYGVIREYRDRKEYKKPSVKKKEKLASASKRKNKPEKTFKAFKD
ncbi:MAG: 30S ribosomal protein S21 [Bdellovibrio sp. CG12_big_fil_rev_8_21_14_0_65_39_13]|nr:MAG: 30S ribosomal protein S21 [Bdellovibrio sp. CG22_combo_CG10-13_8_21_14_all_39_27]PIQ58221.1 MAG: 30S ribosomal protein S21 [Bdellovibrio sp. CG12_big_fil_rev_8_21_14_0_65_39_13]PIR36630.1 MAG: 30S ribosomal protein S21 [Bdellovibrio sp. CG11_big_fil_rev_8_21_14_0_20_39_38]PJB52797.1 MAG: 30S ribosomal protein S21 [Bdellovibrio sp. CG_4_9_14_3_um_filter_39_7]